MKKISILGILAILVIVAEFTYAMIAGWVDMKNSFLEGYNSVNVHSGTPQPEYSGLIYQGKIWMCFYVYGGSGYIS